MKNFDYTKPFQTRSGRKAELLAVINNDETPLVVKITYSNDKEYILLYRDHGKFNRNPMLDDEMDLINIPQKRTFYYNVFNSETALSDHDSTIACHVYHDYLTAVDRGKMSDKYIETRSVEIEL